MQDMQQNKELTIASNRSLAEQNLSLQPELDHQKIQLTKRYCCLQDLHESYQIRKSTLGDIWAYHTFQTTSQTFVLFKIEQSMAFR